MSIGTQALRFSLYNFTEVWKGPSGPLFVASVFFNACVFDVVKLAL